MHVLESWACGVILFTLLAGSPPFWHRKQMLMLRMIMEGRYQFSSPEWDDRSDTVKDLVRLVNLRKLKLQHIQLHLHLNFKMQQFMKSDHKMYNHFAAQISRLLVVDPAVRLTAEQALAHPFFRLYQKDDVRLFSPRKTFRVSHNNVINLALKKCKPLRNVCLHLLSLLVPSGADSHRVGLHQDVQPLPQSSPADSGGAGQRSLLPPRSPQTHRRLRLPHLRSLGEERGAAEPSRPLPEHC